jgi:serine/threonine protein kinase/uncharacterized membrane protein
MFLHGGWMHLGGNMLYLWIFGDNLEKVMGHARFLIFYLVCGIAAAITHIVFSGGSAVPTVGASGAISGVLGGYLVLFPRNRVRVLTRGGIMAVPAIVVLGFWIVIQLIQRIRIGRVDRRDRWRRVPRARGWFRRRVAAGQADDDGQTRVRSRVTWRGSAGKLALRSRVIHTVRGVRLQPDLAPPYNRRSACLCLPAAVSAPMKSCRRSGAGGMGEVYRARDPRLGRDVAIKVLPESLATDPARLHRFEQEARAVAALSHPNVLAIFDIGTEQPPFIVTELLDGETLRARIDRGPLAPRPTIDLALQLVAGLAAAHARGIVHRDLKPQNVFVTGEGVVKILDFGLAKSVASDECEAGRGTDADDDQRRDHPRNRRLHGAGAGARRNRRSSRDIFAVGAILYEMATGERAFKGNSPADTMSAVLREQPPDLAVRTGTPPALARIVRRCLEKQANDRFQLARDLAFALESISDVQAAAPLAMKTDEKSIAVLPFEDLSADRSQQAFCEGMAAEIINALAAISGLRVISRTSAVRCREKGLDISEIGVHLKVQTVLEGTVRRAGERLRITAQLVDTADGSQMWPRASIAARGTSSIFRTRSPPLSWTTSRSDSRAAARPRSSGSPTTSRRTTCI